MNSDFWSGAAVTGATSTVILAVGTFLAKQWVQNWVSNKFATKRDLESHGLAIDKQVHSTKMAIRSQIAQRLVSLRLEHIDLLRKAKTEAIFATTQLFSLIRTSHQHFPVKTEVPQEILDEIKTSFKRYHDDLVAKSEALALIRSQAVVYLPERLQAAALQLMNTLDDALGSSMAQLAMKDEYLSQIAALNFELEEASIAAIIGSIAYAEYHLEQADQAARAKA